VATNHEARTLKGEQRVDGLTAPVDDRRIFRVARDPKVKRAGLARDASVTQIEAKEIAICRRG
jgi:hypothetical protein